jgi:hypothetical protein
MCCIGLVIGLNASLQVPPPHKGFLHIRPLLMGTGAVLRVTPAPEFTFLIYVTPVGNYFEVCLFDLFWLHNFNKIVWQALLWKIQVKLLAYLRLTLNGRNMQVLPINPPPPFQKKKKRRF